MTGRDTTRFRLLLGEDARDPDTASWWFRSLVLALYAHDAPRVLGLLLQDVDGEPAYRAARKALTDLWKRLGEGAATPGPKRSEGWLPAQEMATQLHATVVSRGMPTPVGGRKGRGAEWLYEWPETGDWVVWVEHPVGGWWKQAAASWERKTMAEAMGVSEEEIPW